VRRPAASTAIALTLLIAAGCGGGPPISDSGAALLQSQVTAARAAVARGEYALAGQLLDGIGTSVVRLRQQDELGEARAADIAAALDEVRSAVVGVAETTTTAPPPTTTATTTAPPPPSTERDERGRGEPGRGGEKDDDNEKGDKND
jgi:hypothetical protein